MQLLISFCLQTDSINHFIYSEFNGVSFCSWYMTATSQLLKFCIPGTHNSHGARSGDCCFYIYCVNVLFHRKKYFVNVPLLQHFLHGLFIFYLDKWEGRGNLKTRDEIARKYHQWWAEMIGAEMISSNKKHNDLLFPEFD